MVGILGSQGHLWVEMMEDVYHALPAAVVVAGPAAVLDAFVQKFAFAEATEEASCGDQGNASVTS